MMLFYFSEKCSVTDIQVISAVVMMFVTAAGCSLISSPDYSTSLMEDFKQIRLELTKWIAQVDPLQKKDFSAEVKVSR